ncbi:MAG: response regulator transcription factor [Sporichthyaceae bacterium]
MTVTSGLPDGSEAEATRTRHITVLIADGVALYAGALRAMLDGERDMDVVATALSDADLATMATSTKPDIAVIDLDVPGRDGISLSESLAAESPGTQAIFITAGPLPNLVSTALTSRASGLINKHSGSAALLDCIRRVASGHRVIDTRFRTAATTSGATLTLREIDLLRQSASGISIRELAEQLCLSQGTVRNYLSRIIGKLGARNRMEAIRIAREAGWL